MPGRHKQRLCRICKKRPSRNYKSCPPGICKRCYHTHVWPKRSGPATGREIPQVATGDLETRPMVYDGYFGCFLLIEDASFDVATTPEAIVELPWELGTPNRPPRDRRRDGAGHHDQPRRQATLADRASKRRGVRN